jgi:peptidoglycan/LPS O-acetylase OafA/YrhL
MLSRIVNAVLLVVAGAIVGAIGTVAHQITVTWGVPVPLGLIGSLVCYTSLLVGLRLLGDSRWPALCAALGAIAAILLFTQQSAGGSVLIPNDLAGKIWLVAPILIAAVVVAWPDLRGRRGEAAGEPRTS